MLRVVSDESGDNQPLSERLDRGFGYCDEIVYSVGSHQVDGPCAESRVAGHPPRGDAPRIFDCYQLLVDRPDLGEHGAFPGIELEGRVQESVAVR